MHCLWGKTLQLRAGVPADTFGGFSALQALGVLHGYLQHDWSLVAGMAVSLATCGSVTLLALIYRNGSDIAASDWSGVMIGRDQLRLTLRVSRLVTADTNPVSTAGPLVLNENVWRRAGALTKNE